MTGVFAGAWVWGARKAVVSAFVAGHVAATVLWVLPASPLRTASLGAIRYYILPLGLWQSWGMFSPDPPQVVTGLEAEVVDARGLRYNFAFPKQSDYSVWRAIPRYRHPKFAVNLSNTDPEIDLNRMIAAKHVVRQLAIPAEAFPVEVFLVLKGSPCPAPGGPLDAGPAPRQPYPIGQYHFPTLGEVRP